MELKIYNDRTAKGNLSLDLMEELEKRDLVELNEKNTISFVGAFIYSDCINIFLPRSSGTIVDEDKYKYAALTLNVVEKYGRSSETRLFANKSGKIEGELNLTLVRDILTDFQQNGLYTRHHREVRINSGKPDWKRTINRFLPFQTKNGSPVYLDYFSNKSRHSIDNIVSKIHSEIIAFLDINFSWWITGDERERVAPELACPDDITSEASMKVSILKQELSNVYSDRDIRLIKRLIDFLEMKEGSIKSPVITGLKRFS
jgi:hypothetical protein